MAEWFALVESNTTGSGRQFCSVARARGLRPVVLAAQPARYPYLDEDGIDRVVLDTTHVGAVLGACERLTDDGGLAGITSSSEYFITTAAEVAAKLGLSAPDPTALTRCRSKDQQRAALEAAGVPVPAWRAVTDGPAAVAAARAIGGPVVVKPTAGSGSVGVRLCRDEAEVERHAGELLGSATNERGHAMPAVVLVEQFVDGPEFSVETFDDNVIGVVAKHLGPAPFFVECGHDFPAPVEADVDAALGRVARDALAALGLGWGAAHTELRLTATGPVVVEVNPRLAGGMIPTLLSLGAGVDLIDAVVARAAGLRPKPTSWPRVCVAIRFVVAEKAGTVAAIHGLAAARAILGVAAAEVTVPVDAEVVISHSFRDRVGYAIATGADSTTAADRAERAAAHLVVETR